MRKQYLNHQVIISDLEIVILDHHGAMWLYWIKSWVSPFGSWAWGATNMYTGAGRGGFAETKEAARDQAESLVYGRRERAAGAL